jgi:hypothetical protein
MKRGLHFDSPAGSVNSTSLGRPKGQHSSSDRREEPYSVEIPESVGARDGFEEEEKSAGVEEEQNLAAQMERVQMQQRQEEEWERQNIEEAIAHVQMQLQYMQRRYAGRQPNETQQHQAGQLNAELQRLLGIQAELEEAKKKTPAELGRDDMIPALHDLSNLAVSFGSASDVTMTATDSVLGKRPAEDKQATTDPELDLALTLHVEGCYSVMAPEKMLLACS